MTGRQGETGGANTAGIGRQAWETEVAIQSMSDGTQYVEVDTDQDIFDGVPLSEYSKVVAKYIRDHFRGTPILEGKRSEQQQKAQTNTLAAGPLWTIACLKQKDELLQKLAI